MVSPHVSHVLLNFANWFSLVSDKQSQLPDTVVLNHLILATNQNQVLSPVNQSEARIILC